MQCNAQFTIDKKNEEKLMPLFERHVIMKMNIFN